MGSESSAADNAFMYSVIESCKVSVHFSALAIER